MRGEARFPRVPQIVVHPIPAQRNRGQRRPERAHLFQEIESGAVRQTEIAQQ